MPENPEPPENPEQPEPPERPEQPENPEQPEHPAGFSGSSGLSGSSGFSGLSGSSGFSVSSAISTSSLTRLFQTTAGELRALDDLSIEIPRGTIFGLLGPNGAGKTTTVRLLLGLVAPSSGTATVLGLRVGQQDAAIRERCGALLEHDGLYERLTALQNLQFYARIWRLRGEQHDLHLRLLLERFGLWGRRHDLVGSWSRGMKRKLALARALLHAPELIFLDEPTAGLDPGAAADLRDQLAALSKEHGATIFLNTHNLAEAERLCDRIGVIAHGRLRALGSPVELRRQLESSRLQITGRGFKREWRFEGASDLTVREDLIEMLLPAGASAARFVRMIVEQGGEVEEVRRGDATLEDVYLQLIEDAPPDAQRPNHDS